MADHKENDMSEQGKSRANWILDKILLAVCGTLMVMTYNSINSSIAEVAAGVDRLNDKMDHIGKEINAIERRTTVLEYQISHPTPNKR